jgi:hypothetical protein
MGNIDENPRKRFSELLMDAPGGFTAWAFLPRSATIRETHHGRMKGNTPLRLHHLFMAGDSTMPTALATRQSRKQAKAPSRARKQT